MKSASEMPGVEATSPPTFTLALLPNSTPLGLTRNTLPLAERLPRMTEGSAPVTRLSATALALGWTKTTLLPSPIEKFCQLSAADWLVWSHGPGYSRRRKCSHCPRRPRHRSADSAPRRRRASGIDVTRPSRARPAKRGRPVDPNSAGRWMELMTISFRACGRVIRRVSRSGTRRGHWSPGPTSPAGCRCGAHS